MGRIKKASEIASPVFLRNGWHWAAPIRESYEEYIPGMNDIIKALKDLKDTASKHEYAECGRLMVMKQEGRYEYYLNLGK